MKLIKKKSFLIGLFVCILALLSSVVTLLATNTTASAFVGDSLSDYTFTKITTEEGEAAYKVGVKSTCRSKIKIANIPEEYNGLPVVEIADNGFSTCKNLIVAYIPSSVKTIGTSAFRNCAKLQRAPLPAVETIKKYAFGACPNVSLHIPETTTIVEAAILQNNPNTLYINNNEDFVRQKWSDNWNDLHTGDVVYDSELGEAIEYNIVKDKDDNFGVEIVSHQLDEAPDTNLVLYNAIFMDEFNKYLPVLNITNGAFQYAYLNSITFMDIRDKDSTAPNFNNKINVESHAFESTLVTKIDFYTEVTFYDSYDNYKQNNEQISTDVFTDAFTLESITLPADLTAISDNMFCRCDGLKEIHISGEEYDGRNMLPNVTAIGDGAFDSCVGLDNIYIPSTVKTMGIEVFKGWGEYVDHQEIHIDFYDDEELPWDDSWTDGKLDNAIVVYKQPTEITIKLYDDEKRSIQVKIDRDLTGLLDFSTITRYGYDFAGIFAEQNGEVKQFYNENGQAINTYKEDDPTDWYVNWTPKVSTIEFKYTDYSFQVEFGGDMPDAPVPEVEEHHTFYGYYLDIDGEITYYYGPECNKLIENWDREDEYVLFLPKIGPTTYNIEFEVEDWKGNTNPNKLTYSYGEEYDFEKLEATGFNFNWEPSGINPEDSGDKIVYGTWDVIKYSITYNLNDGTNSPDNPTEWVYGQSITLKDPTRLGYKFTGWYTNNKTPKVEVIENLYGDLVLNATWDAEHYVIDDTDTSLLVTEDYAIVKLPDFSFQKPFTLYINYKCEHIYIYTRYNMTYRMRIVVTDRTEDLYMTSSGFTISPDTDEAGISMSQGTLYLKVLAKSYIYGGNGSDGARSGASGLPGQPGIKCNNLVIEDSKYIYIQGGNGGNGVDGANGADGKNGTKPPSGSIFYPVDGESGQKGYDGQDGGNGGDGAPAIFAAGGSIVMINSSVKLVPGNGGNGANGGNGGNGGKGASDTSPNWVNGVGNPGNGGDGGNGGNGGNAGRGASAVIGTLKAQDPYNLVIEENATNGQIGYGGTGGTGGKGGSNGVIGTNGTNGKPGAPGADGVG